MSDRTYGLFENQTNERLIAKLGEKQAELILFPEIIARKMDLAQTVDLSLFHWIIFPDLKSVDFFLGGMSEKFALDDIRVCALGEAVTDRLRFSQLHADVLPAKVDLETVFRAIEQYQSPEGLNFLILKERNSVSLLSALLQTAGASIMELPVYELKYPADLSRFKSLLLGGAIDEFIFTNPQDVFDLACLIDLQKAEFRSAATDEITFQTLMEFNTSPVPYKQ